MIEPTVGRVVWYHPGLQFRGHYEDPNKPLAAHVAAVKTNQNDFGWLLNLMVIDANGVPFAMQNVMLFQGDRIPEAAVVGDRGWCEWMPYQKGQAAKTEQLESAFAGMKHSGSQTEAGINTAGPFAGLMRGQLEHEDNL